MRNIPKFNPEKNQRVILLLGLLSVNREKDLRVK